MYKTFLILTALAVSLFPSHLQALQAAAPDVTQSTTPAASAAANKVNPVHATPQSQARAKAIYGFDCAMCHGAAGDGKGDMNADGKMKVRDWRDPAILKNLSDGEIYGIIDVGRADMPEMPPESGRAKPDELWNLVIYLRAFAKSGTLTAQQ